MQAMPRPPARDGAKAQDIGVGEGDRAAHDRTCHAAPSCEPRTCDGGLAAVDF